jgi:hypothetical protein
LPGLISSRWLSVTGGRKERGIMSGSENVPVNIMVEHVREAVELARKYKMSYAEVIGVLEMVKQEVIDESKGAT